MTIEKKLELDNYNFQDWDPANSTSRNMKPMSHTVPAFSIA